MLVNTIYKILLIGAAMIICRCAYSQSYDNNWVFGDSIGLNFSTGEPVFFETGINNPFEACASISDSDGNLLFYTNGNIVWDGNHSIMPNGEDLDIGYATPDHGSTITQGVLIAPAPLTDSLFYIIYLSRITIGTGCCLGLKYSVVNMKLNGGLGDISEKNMLLPSDTLTEKLQLVKHGNGRDWWLIALSKVYNEGELPRFVKFLISPSGIEGPFYQAYAATYQAIDGDNQDMGYMKFSQQGDKVCIAKGKDADVYDFNRCTGEFTNYINISNLVQEWDLINIIYGIEYAVNGRYLYISTYNYAASVSRPYLYQFCVSCPEPLEETKATIYEPDTGMYLAAMLLAPNGKIYMTSYSVDNPSDTLLYVINNPEAGGISCNFDSIKVSTGGIAFPKVNGLPNMPNYNLGPLEGSECDTLVAVNNLPPPKGIKLYPNPASDHIYLDGSEIYSSGVIDLHLYNLLGDEVFKYNNVELNTSTSLPELPNGLYEVVLETGGQLIYSGKLEIYR